LGRLVRLTARRRLIAAAAALLVPLRARGAGQAEFARRAMQLRDEATRAGDQPYGAVVVKDGRIVAEAPSRVVTAGDPTAHAEMEAIRDAARKLGTRNLADCDLYGSSRACRMCEAAAYWAGIARLFHGADATGGYPPQL
jgi:guanine deaminase